MISGDEIVEPVRSRNIAAQPARVAKLADAGGLNPPSIHVEYGFKSRPGHHTKSCCAFCPNWQAGQMLLGKAT
jgi:hypothetical protein